MVTQKTEHEPHEMIDEVEQYPFNHVNERKLDHASFLKGDLGVEVLDPAIQLTP